jgi:hypothetical protein
MISLKSKIIQKKSWMTAVNPFFKIISQMHECYKVRTNNVHWSSRLVIQNNDFQPSTIWHFLGKTFWVRI